MGGTRSIPGASPTHGTWTMIEAHNQMENNGIIWAREAAEASWGQEACTSSAKKVFHMGAVLYRTTFANDKPWRWTNPADPNGCRHSSCFNCPRTPDPDY